MRSNISKRDRCSFWVSYLHKTTADTCTRSTPAQANQQPYAPIRGITP